MTRWFGLTLVWVCATCTSPVTERAASSTEPQRAEAQALNDEHSPIVKDFRLKADLVSWDLCGFLPDGRLLASGYQHSLALSDLNRETWRMTQPLIAFNTGAGGCSGVLFFNESVGMVFGGFGVNQQQDIRPYAYTSMVWGKLC